MNKSNEVLLSEIRSGINQQEGLLQLFNQNRGLIETVIRPYLSICERDDLEQEAFCGLLHAVSRYDPEQGCPFITFALPWIRQTVGRYTHQSGQIRLPEHIINQIYRMNRIAREYEAKQGCYPPDSVLCARLRISSDELQRLKQVRHDTQTVSMSAPILSEDEDITLEDIIPDKRDEISSVLDEIESSQIWQAVDDLEEEQQQAVRARFLDGMQYNQIADMTGQTLDTIKRVERAALNRLKKDQRIKQAGEAHGYYHSTSRVFRGGLQSFRERGSIVENLALEAVEPFEQDEDNL